MNLYKYYVYAYIRSRDSKTANAGTPYYIGKGTGRRRFQKGGRPVKVPKDRTRIVLLHENILEEDAFALEISYIKLYGKKCDGTGILHNISDGGKGGSTSENSIKIRDEGKNPNFKLSKDVIEKIFFDTRIYREIAEEYGVSQTTIRDIKHKKRWIDVTKNFVITEEEKVIRKRNIGGSKLTEDKVKSIFFDPRSYREIAEDYGVNRATITEIKNKKIWKNVTKNFVITEEEKQLRKKRKKGNNVKLTVDDVRKIRNDKRSLKEIAAEYNIFFGTVSQIRTGKRWKHVV